jgi:hypothetical protein
MEGRLASGSKSLSLVPSSCRLSLNKSSKRSKSIKLNAIVQNYSKQSRSGSRSEAAHARTSHVADALAVAQNVDEGVDEVQQEKSVYQVADAEEILKERDACGVGVDCGVVVAIRVAGGTEFLLLLVDASDLDLRRVRLCCRWDSLRV